LLQVDGPVYYFTRRSFQEFFCSRFFSKRRSVDYRMLLDDICLRLSDNVIPLMFSVDRRLIDEEWIEPFIEGYSTRFGSPIMYNDTFSAITFLFSQVELVYNPRIKSFQFRCSRETRDFCRISQILKCYPTLELSLDPSDHTAELTITWLEYFFSTPIPEDKVTDGRSQHARNAGKAIFDSLLHERGSQQNLNEVSIPIFSWDNDAVDKSWLRDYVKKIFTVLTNLRKTITLHKTSESQLLLKYIK
jgi:hypothetical protein